MEVKIRLQRKGKKNQPLYRVVVTKKSAAAKGGGIIEIIGTYQPLPEPSGFKINKEKAQAWLKNGAQPSYRLRKLFSQIGLLEPLPAAKLKKKPPKLQKTEAAKEDSPKKEPAQVKKEVQEKIGAEKEKENPKK